MYNNNEIDTAIKNLTNPDKVERNRAILVLSEIEKELRKAAGTVKINSEIHDAFISKANYFSLLVGMSI